MSRLRTGGLLWRIEFRHDQRVIRDLCELDAVEFADGAGFGVGVAIAEVDFFDAISAEHLGATRAGFCGAGDELDVATSEEGAEVDLGVEHKFAPLVAVEPEFMVGIEAGSQAVVGRADDAVVVIEGDGTDFAKGILRAQAGDVSQGHGVFRDGQARATGDGRLGFF